MDIPQHQSEKAARFLRLLDFWRQDRGNRALILDLARAGIEARQTMQVAEALSDYLSHEPADREAQFMLGTIWLMEKQYERAESQFDALLHTCEGAQPHQAIIYNLAYASSGRGKYSEACATLGRLTDSQWSENNEAHLLYARSAHHLERFDEGKKHYLAYLGRSPENSDAWGELALLYFDNDDTELSRAAAQRALTLNGDTVSALIAEGSIALEQQDGPAAWSQFSRAVQLQPINGRAWSGLGFAYFLLFDFGKANESFARAVQHMPQHIGTWHGLGWVQILQNDLDGAKRSFEEALALDRTFGETHGGLAVVAVMSGKGVAAQPMVRRGLGLNPQSFSAQFAQSLLLKAEGNTTQAQKLVNSILGQGDGGLVGFQRLIAQVVRKASAHERGNSAPADQDLFMTPDLAFGLSREMLWVAARVAGPIIVTSMAVGLVISIFQVVTQIQEMTLTFIPKLFAIFLLLLLAGPWMLATLVEFGVAIISGIPNYINQRK